MSSPGPAKRAPQRLMGRQEPRLLTMPATAVGSLVDDALALWDLTGRRLDPWQEITCEPTFAVDTSGNLAASEVGWLVSRQQGKGEALQVYDLSHLYLWPKPDGEPKVILHTAHEFATVDAHYRKLRRRILSTPWLRRQLKGGGVEDARGVSGISTGMGKRIFELQDGSLLILQTRTGSAGVGESVDKLIVDEAQHSPTETMDALLFTMDGVPNAQVLYTGTVPTAIQDGAHFESLRDRGRAGTYPRTVWVEFSPDGSDDPDIAASIDPLDREVWRQSSPALGRRTTEEYILDRYNAMKDHNLAGFLAQRLSIWPNRRPVAEQTQNSLDLKTWTTKGTDRRLQPGGVVLAVALGRGGTYSSIGGAQRLDDRTFLVQHLDTRPGTLWVAERLAELKREFSATAIVADGLSIVPILSDLETSRLTVKTMTTNEVGAATELFVESVNAGIVQHPRQEELALSLEWAVPRSMGRSKLTTWEQGNATEPVTQALTVTHALWGVKWLESQRSRQPANPTMPAVLGSDDRTINEGGYHLPQNAGRPAWDALVR